MENKIILLVDDQKINLDLMEKYLEEQGYNIIITQESMNVVTTVKEKKPDAIIMDIIMPHKKGDDIALELKKDPETKNIPIILITADILHEKENMKADYFIRRPIIGEELINILKNIFSS